MPHDGTPWVHARPRENGALNDSSQRVQRASPGRDKTSRERQSPEDLPPMTALDGMLAFAAAALASLMIVPVVARFSAQLLP